MLEYKITYFEDLFKICPLYFLKSYTVLYGEAIRLMKSFKYMSVFERDSRGIDGFLLRKFS